MSNVARHVASGALANIAAVPVISADLGYAADAAMTYSVTRAPPPARQAEARSLLPALDRALNGGSSFEVVNAWLEPLVLAVNNPPSQSDAYMKALSIHDTSGDLPPCVWTAETRREFIRAKGAALFWPGSGEVDAFLRAKRDALVKQRDGIRAIADFGVVPVVVPPADKPASQVERDAILAKFRADYAVAMAPVREGLARPSGALRVEARPISAGHLAQLRASSPLVLNARAMAAQISREVEGEADDEVG